MKLKFKIATLRQITRKHPHEEVTFLRVAKYLAIGEQDFETAAKLRQYEKAARERDFIDFVDKGTPPAKQHKPAHGGRCS